MTTATYEEELADQTQRYQSMFATGPGKTFTGDDAIRWCETILKREYWSFEKNFVRAAFDNQRVVARSCNGIGKSLVCADIALCSLLNKGPAKIVTLAPTFPQVRNTLWAEINTSFNLMKSAQVDGEPDMMNGIECQQTRLELGPGWFAVGLSPDKGVNLQGLHQRNVMAILDEAPGIRPEITTAVRKLLTGRNSYMVEIGNPLASSGDFFNHCRMGTPYEPGMKDMPGWVTFHISYEDTPNFTHLQEDPDPIDVNLAQEIKDQLISEAWVGEMAEVWGVDSPAYYSAVKGEFPPDDGLSVIPLHLCMEAVYRQIEPTGEMVLGVDVGGGGDLSAFCRRRGQVIVGDVVTKSTQKKNQIIEQIVKMNAEDHYALVTVDTCGIGWGIDEDLRALGIPARGIKVSESALNPERYHRRRDELWYAGRDWLETGSIPSDLHLIADLTGPQKLNPSPTGAQRIEGKQDTKKRLKTRSPDRGDAFLLAIQTNTDSGIWAYR